MRVHDCNHYQSVASSWRSVSHTPGRTDRGGVSLNSFATSWNTNCVSPTTAGWVDRLPAPPTRSCSVSNGVYLTTRSLDPTGHGKARWVVRWKPALNAFAITFAGRFERATH